MTARTDLQNNSLHLWARQLSEALNDAGFDFKKFLEIADYKLDVPFTEEIIKDQLIRPVAKVMFEADSTTELDTKQIQEVYKVVDARISELTGVHVEWPDRWNQHDEK